MSWLRIEGRMPQHRKVAPLSDAAFRLHVTAQAWCVEEETDGQIPLAIPGTLTSAPRGRALGKAIEELLDAQLWESEAAGYAIHDFLKYNPSHAQKEADRQAVKRRVKRHRETVGNGVTRTGETPPPIPIPIPDRILPKTSAKGPDRLARAPDEGAAAAENLLIPCPPDLKLTAQQRGTLELSALIPGWAIEELTTRFVAKMGADPGDLRLLVTWRKCLASAVTGDWQNAARRPKAPSNTTGSSSQFEESGDLERAMGELAAGSAR